MANSLLGQLIAFRIISGYVTQPLLRLSTIWQRIQELRVSFERLADIVDTPKNQANRSRQNPVAPNCWAGKIRRYAIPIRSRKATGTQKY